jgi:molybdenum cofactor synthesis domain-containing protein
MKSNAAILAIGSELLAGQIVNGNAAWLSARLLNLGIDTITHLTVDDIQSDIVSGISHLANSVELILITGGLGPTSDDLTRHAVAAWTQRPLRFDDSSWEHVKSQLARVGAAVPEANKQQCYFPEGAEILTNSAGTANGFRVDAHGKELWVLPGPPREVEAIWQTYMLERLTTRVPANARKTLRMWRMIGQGESHLAELITPLVTGHAVEVAYRVHAPYVELKLRFPTAEAARYDHLCEQLTKAMQPWLFETDRENTVASLAQCLQGYRSIEIYDSATQGQLAELLTPHLRHALGSNQKLMFHTHWQSQDEDPTVTVQRHLHATEQADLTLAVAGVDQSGRWALGLRRNGQTEIAEHATPYRHSVQRSRTMKAIAALAAKSWSVLLERV